MRFECSYDFWIRETAAGKSVHCSPGQDAVSYLKLYFMIQKESAKASRCASRYSELHSIFNVSSGNFFLDAGGKKHTGGRLF